MARLIVEEAGARRAFRVGEGVLSIGSGAEARLKLTSPDVAEVHAELAIVDGQATLRPRPGVVPPQMGGAAMSGEAPLGFGVEVTVGSARLWLEAEEGDPAPAGASPAAAPAAAAPSGSAPAGHQEVQAATQEKAIRRQRAMADAKSRGSRSVVQRTKPRVQRGLPGYVIGILIVAGAGIGGLVIFRGIQSSANQASSAGVTLTAVAGYIEEGNLDVAEKQLAGMTTDLTGAEKVRRDELAKLIEEKRAQADLDVENAVGTRYKDTMLAKYSKLYLAGTPERPKVRVFLQRIKEFKRRWPDHPEMDWVERQEDRFRGLVSLADPTTLEDVQWEVECLTRTSPRDYKQAFAVLEEFAGRASGGDATTIDELRATMISDREEYHLDRMQQAKYEFERDAAAAAVSWLVYSIIMIGDTAMENEAANYLIKMPDIGAHLKGWKSRRPEDWEILIQNRTVRECAAENDLL